MDADAPNTFGYRTHVSWIQWIGMGAPAVAAVGLMTFQLYCWFTFGILDPFIAGLALVLGLESLLLFAVLRALATSLIRLNDEGLEFANYRKEGSFTYEEIESVRGWYLPYIGGWVTICAPDTTLRMTVVLDDIDVFVEQLYERLRTLEAPPFEHDNVFGFYKTAVFSNQSWDRWYQWTQWLRVAMTSAVSVGIIWLLSPAAWLEMSIVLVLGISIPLIVMGVGECIVFARYIARHADPEAFSVSRQMPEDMEARYLRYLMGASVIATALTVGFLRMGFLG